MFLWGSFLAYLLDEARAYHKDHIDFWGEAHNMGNSLESLFGFVCIVWIFCISFFVGTIVSKIIEKNKANNALKKAIDKNVT